MGTTALQRKIHNDQGWPAVGKFYCRRKLWLQRGLLIAGWYHWEERRLYQSSKRLVWLFLFDDSSYLWNALRITAMAPVRERNIFGLIRVDSTSYIIAFIPRNLDRSRLGKRVSEVKKNWEFLGAGNYYLVLLLLELPPKCGAKVSI